MKELTIEQARKVLKQEGTVVCQLSNRNDNTEVVRTKERLEYLYKQSKEGTLMCKIYENLQSKVNLPENSIEISFDEAYVMVHSGELVYYQENGEEEEINSISELIGIRRRFDLNGQKLLIYWYE